MNQNSISTRVNQSTIEYLEINYKNKFQGARMFLEAFPVLREESIKVLKKVFEELGPRFESRTGGYTRMVKLGQRKGDAAPMAIVELLPSEITDNTDSETAS